MLESATILLVDDDPTVRKVLSSFLERCGFAVTTAASGEKALEAARSFNGAITILISDLTMPGISGADLARQLLQTHPGLKVLLISATTVAPADLDAGWQFLAKPFAPDLLLGKIRQISGPKPDAHRAEQSYRNTRQ
jgi:DNA-binding response OmpR family regulator